MLKLLFNRENRNFSRLWMAQLISQFGDRIHQMALVGLIAERSPGSAMDLAKLIAFTILPVFLIQPIAGVFVDRWDRKTILFICDIFRGALVLTIPLIFIFWKSIIPIYGVVFLVFCFSRFYIPAKMSILPDLVESKNLLMANSLVSTTGMIAFVLGCALGGWIIDRHGARVGFLIDGITFLISAMFIISIRFPLKLRINRKRILQVSREILTTAKQSFWGEIRGGFQYLFSHKEIRFILSMLFTLLSAAGAIYVVLIIFIQQSFHNATRDLGVLAVYLGLGLFLGALGYGRWGKHFAGAHVIFFCLTLGGLMMMVFAYSVYFYANIIMAIVLSFLLGLIVGPIFIAANTTVHMVSDESMRGKVFSALEIVIHLAFLSAMLVSSFLSEYISRVWILLGVGIIFACVGTIGFLRSRHVKALAFDR